MEEGSTTRVGLDVRKASIDVTIAEAGAAGEVRHFGTVGGDLEAVAKLIRRLRSSSRPPGRLGTRHASSGAR